MTGVENLLAEFIAEHRGGGEADPTTYLARASPADRLALAAMIDAYLARAPREGFDEQAFRGSTAERTVDALERSLTGSAGLWPAVLPELRDRAGLKRSELVARLAGLLGVSDRTEKVARYYHEMEQGLLPSRGVSERVLEALGGIVGESVAALREAGRALGSTAAGAAGPEDAVRAAFARRATADAAAAVPAAAASGDVAEWDEVDELFRGA
jgi:hypothetical protein